MSKEAVYERASMDNSVGYGERPAVLVVDLQKGFTDPENPLGGDLSGVLDRTNAILGAAHAADVPVVHTRIVSSHPTCADMGIWQEKIPRLDTLAAGSEWVELDERLAVADDDHVLDKRQASGFHETELNSMLVAWGVDTLIVTGCTTSGCIRASVVDACAHGYRTIVPAEAVGDRSAAPHDANLFDMNAKYADVRPVEEVVEYLEKGR
ncbi:MULTISPECIES: isochorismatase family protein [unclassified Haladaptatus]|uniref:isochorismatase family protein n=1 Tax=unclassified Haladaptatus TaxID=2622732 RepID=UPI0023E8AB72|nr:MULTISPECIES: isochorismatase family protein [unclassified Haladaptatus]